MQPHPAPFSVPILSCIRELMQGEVRARVLDPFGGTGRVLDALPPRTSATIIDIESSYITEGLVRYNVDLEEVVNRGDELMTLINGVKALWIAGDSFEHLRRRRKRYTHIITSPTYGNRFKDAFNPAPGRRCRSYAQSKGGPLEAANTGRFGLRDDMYDLLNYRVMQIAVDRLEPGGTCVVNVSDFYATLTKGAAPTRMEVVNYWLDLCARLGLHLYRAIPVVTRRFKEGENRHRADHEMVLVFTKENVDVRTRTR